MKESLVEVSPSMLMRLNELAAAWATRCRAASPQLAFARASPSFLVPALAFPVLTMNARRDLPEARCSFATCTGAAQKRFCVNAPATRVPSARVMRSRSLRPAFLIPASATPSFTPLTGRRSSGLGGLRLTAMPPLTQLPVTMLVFLSRPAGTRIVAADLAHLPHERRRLGRGRRIGAGSGKRLFVSGVLVLHVFDSRSLDLFRLLDLLPSLQLDRHQGARDLELDRLHEVAEQLT